MKILDLRKKKSQNSNAACAVQTSIATNHPYYNLTSYMPINGESRVYAELRNAVPILDAAINKIVRLCEGFRFDTGNEKINDMMNSYFESINVGGNQRGITSFVSNYLNQLLTFGTAIGEIVMCSDGIYALYNSELSSIELKRAKNGIDVDFYNNGSKINQPNLILYSVLNPKPSDLCGTSLLSGLPFVSNILLEIYNTIGENWKHAGNLRYSVIGLSWSSTERMSTQQADILTSELESYRRILEPVIKQIGNMYLAINALPYEANIEWKKITLQDECDEAKAQLYTQQAEKIRREIEN